MNKQEIIDKAKKELEKKYMYLLQGSGIYYESQGVMKILSEAMDLALEAVKLEGHNIEINDATFLYSSGFDDGHQKAVDLQTEKFNKFKGEK